MSVLIETSLGDLVIDTLFDQREQPAFNFIKLCAVKYYNACKFFYVDSNFIARTGDAEHNNGQGGMSIYAKLQQPQHQQQPILLRANDIHATSSTLTHGKKGVVSFICSDNGLYASQFFITLTEGLQYLDDQRHVIFGYVSEGLDKFITNLKIHPIQSSTNTPLTSILIEHTIILHDPFTDHHPYYTHDENRHILKNLNLIIPPSSPIIYYSSDSDSDSNSDSNSNSNSNSNQLNDELQTQSRAQVLEIVGDIHHADLKPPDNVLFVCKLNPITNAEGLQIIFSRFGPCHVDVILDKLTLQSLCYAFIEFHSKSQCENAYYKMNQTLIDDRLIHVDFSQSVSKLWNDMRRNTNHNMHTNTNTNTNTNYTNRNINNSNNFIQSTRQHLHSNHTNNNDDGDQTIQQQQQQVKKRRKSRFDRVSK